MSNDYIAPPGGLAPGAVVWAYLRDSGGEGQEQSVAQQRAEIELYCSSYGLALLHVLADVAKSGGTVVGRDAFNDLVDITSDPDLRPGGLLLWNFARFARDLDDSSYYKALLRKRGIIVHSLTDPIPEGPYGRVVETLIDIANEEKRRQTARDVKRALAALTRQGFAPGGFPPRGYIAEHVMIGMKRDGKPRVASRWIPDPELWDPIRLAWALRAEGKSYGEIQKATAGTIYKSKNCWPTFFRNKSYLGIGKCGALEVPDHHPPAVDFTTWEAVQQMLQAAPQRGQTGHPNHPRRVGAPSLLSGLAVCIHCGAAVMSGRSNMKRGNPWPYYLCGRKSREGWRTCEGRTMNGRKADAAILDAVQSRVLTSDFANNLLLEVRARFADSAALEREAEQIQKALSDCENGIRHLVDQVEHFGSSRLVADKLREREGERMRLLSELHQLRAKAQAADVTITPEALGIVLAAWLGELKGAMESGDKRALRAFMMRFVSKVELGYNVARVWYTYPLDGLTLDWKALTWGHLRWRSAGSVGAGALL